MRDIGLDVHRDFCEVAIWEAGALRSAGRIATTPEQLELFARSLAKHDRVALEVTGNAWEIARILEPHVATRRWPKGSRDARPKLHFHAESRSATQQPLAGPAASATRDVHCWRA